METTKADRSKGRRLAGSDKSEEPEHVSLTILRAYFKRTSLPSPTPPTLIVNTTGKSSLFAWPTSEAEARRCFD